MEYPLVITIPRPAAIPRARGAHATGHLGGVLNVRISKADRELIQELAKELGMSPAQFARWCAVHVAHELKRYRDGDSDDDQP